MPRPPLDHDQIAKALAAYHEAREQAVRYVLGALDPTAFNAPALPYLEVLTRVQAVIVAEIGRYTAETEAAPTADEPQGEGAEEQADATPDEH